MTAWKRWSCLALLSLMPVFASAADIDLNLSFRGSVSNLSLDLSLAVPAFSCPSPNGCTPPTYYLFVAAIVPAGTTTVSPGTYLLNSSREWVFCDPFFDNFPPYLAFSGVNGGASLSVPGLLDQMNFAGLTGTRLLVGYGLSDREMLSAQRYREIYIVPWEPGD